MRYASRLALLTCLILAGCDPASETKPTGDSEAVSDAEPTGDDLKAQLHDMVDGHTELNYRELWDALAITDADPDNPGNVLLLYTGWSRSADLHGNDPSGWNREHVWSKSRGDFGTRPGAGTDLHMLRPADVTVNAARGNKAFDEGGTLYVDGDGPTRCRSDRDSWEPRPEVRGDVARAIFYMVVRYEDAGLDLELTGDARGQGDRAPVHGVASTLLRWHEEDPPDDAERRRNDRVEKIQGNRNPFVDRPEFVGRVWG